MTSAGSNLSGRRSEAIVGRWRAMAASLNDLRRRLPVIVAFVAMTIGFTGLNAPPASAYAWDPHVLVIGSVSSCGPSASSGWGWFQADDGESGWMRWGPGSTFSFDLYRVPGWGGSTLVTIKWGVSTCSAVRYRVISRPAYGNIAGLGYLG
jgi:hypothetical protein